MNESASSRASPADREAVPRGGDVDYGVIGTEYAHYRREEPAIAAVIHRMLGSAVTVVNIGAGAGSYEPRGRRVTAIEPSAVMRSQRGGQLPAAVDAMAEDLPFRDDEFDGGMSTFSVHQWRDLKRGLSELRRVTRGPVVVLTCDPDALDRFWLVDYAPEVIEVERRRYPAPRRIARILGDDAIVEPVPIPLACVDGFGEAYYGRPELLLDPGARRANSAWSFVPADVHERFEHELGRDLADGTWDERYGTLRSVAQFEGSLVAVYSAGASGSSPV